MLQGELVLTRQDDAWRATISDAETAFQTDGEAIRVAFPRGLGKFRGTMTGERDPIAGFWLQPGVTVERPDPVGSRQAFATPLVLQRSIVVPELDLAVVFTGGNYRQGSIWLRWRGDIVGDAIIAAIR